MGESQTLLEGGPRWVKFHDGEGRSFAFLVLKEDESADGSINELSGAVWCDDVPNGANLSEGWNSRNKIGRSDDSLEVPAAVSWSPWE